MELKGYTQKSEAFPILDSSLISPTKIYDIKLVDCGEYTQIYFYEKTKNRIKNDIQFELELKKQKIDNMFEPIKKENKKENELSNIISLKNITRSKLECQRIAKANMNDWKSFITLTFEENITNTIHANKRFQYYVDKVRRVKKDFKYLCITEFQKRGAIHYHLLTNIECDSDLIPRRPLKHLFKPSINDYKDLEYYDLKYWIDGFSSAEPIINDAKKVVGYISKYMTKDIDNRLFSKHRYFYSKNLNKPLINYIDCDNKKEYDYYLKKIQDKELIYQNEYINPYDNSKVTFLELQ